MTRRSGDLKRREQPTVADEEHLRQLLQGVRGWNEWRTRQDYLFRADLSGADLGGADLKQTQLAATSLEAADLEGAQLAHNAAQSTNHHSTPGPR